MAEGQDLLNLMELVDRELQLQPSEPDVTRGLLALNAAQDHFEAIVANERGLLGDSTGTVTTSSSTETTTFPSGVLRIDRLQFIDAATSRPSYDLVDLYETGGHIWNRYPAFLTSSANTTGQPRAYYTDGTNIYWEPLPDGTHTIRWYGFEVAEEITAGGTFSYPDSCMMPFAAYAAKLFQIGLDDNPRVYSQMSAETFAPIIAAMGNFRRTGARPVRTRRIIYDYY